MDANSMTRKSARQTSKWNLTVVMSVFLILNYVNVKAQEPRIVNGQLATYNGTKHQVSIRLKSQDSPFGSSHVCGGSLIGRNKVLTAAHCVYNSSKKKYRSAKEFSVVMGTLNRYQKPNGTIVSDVSSIATMGTFNIATMQDDVALLFLKTGLPENKTHLTVEPIPLSNTTTPVGTICQVSGWGKTNPATSSLPKELRIANVSIISKTLCAASYVGTLKAGMLCAGYMQGGSDACQGDSGGPLVCNGSLVGVVSWGNGCGLQRYPGIYADVNYYHEWITKTNAGSRGGWSWVTMLGTWTLAAIVTRRKFGS